ncbi:HAMP domain-containing sensor histidine kinase [Leptolyngbya sp. FACHB-261]|uniref:sensor histidine kinase n=1 Tax=Leptolyngbya sp. FACHB-261 TaxID=2692806 RepID=UPI0016849B72|nr:ATP-binding protein [Leptolyngbya sp. FACHB-261]MBD2101080.1 hypothetical protein [Leptolyngbya sp. FACHB-261]
MKSQHSRPESSDCQIGVFAPEFSESSSPELSGSGLAGIDRQLIRHPALEGNPWDQVERLREQMALIRLRLSHCEQELVSARQAAQESERIRNEFLANISHELRTPLNGTIGLLKLVLDGMTDGSEEQSQFIEQAYQSSLRLLECIAGVLDLGNLDAGNLKLHTGPVNLRELLTEVERIVRPQAEHKRLELVVEHPNLKDEIILQGDHHRLLQVLLNLVGNAVKFTPEGSIRISLNVGWQSDLLTLYICDTGIGVPLERSERLFQPFYQVDGARTRQYGGLGLGLTISRQLMEAMGGEVHFYSLGEGLGSTVTVRIPLYHRPVLV